MAVGTRYEPKQAKQLILAGKARAGMHVDGTLDLAGSKDLTRLPKGLKCFELDVSGTPLTQLPDDIDIECGINLQGCNQLKKLPEGLKTGTLNLRGCQSLRELPDGLSVWFLDISGCQQLRSFPKRGKIENGNLSLAGCAAMTELPSYLSKLATLDISDCPLICALPKNLSIGLWIDVGGSGLTGLPASLKTVGIRWRGVGIDYNIAFHPEKITATAALTEVNAERRRVMIERMGYDRFMAEAKAKRLDQDTDPGGMRELYRVPLKDDEDIVCMSCNCPSTGRHYLLRVPPTVKTCHQAAAWMAGFDDPRKYKPVIET